MKKRSLIFGTLLIAVLALAGCKSSKAPEGYYTLKTITEGDTTVKEKDLDEYGLEDSYVVFEDGGDGYLVLLDTPTDFSFNKKKGILETSYGDVTLINNGKTVTLADGQVSMEFQKSKDDIPERPDAGLYAYTDGDGYQNPVGGDDTDWDEIMGIDRSAMETFWNGEWFGWWELNGMINEWDQYEGVKYPVLATTSLDSDGNGEIYLWDNDGELADVICTNNGYGLTELGTMVSESGTFYDKELEHADWNIDPGIDQHEGAFQIDAYYRDEEGHALFDYTIHLVKWGYTWSDFDEDELPDEYDWYMEQIENGNPMPDSLPE